MTAGEPYYFAGCTTSTCVFPNAVIPQRAWSAPAQHLLQYIPAPNIGDATFSTGGQSQVCATTKAASAWMAAVTRWGLLSAYYFFDDFRLDNPVSHGPRRRQRSRFQCAESGPRPAHLARPHQDLRPVHGERTAPELHAQRQQRRAAVRRRRSDSGLARFRNRRRERRASCLCCPRSKASRTSFSILS